MSAHLLGSALAALMFLSLCFVILSGIPVLFVLTGSAILFGALGMLAGVLDPFLLRAIAQRIFGTMTSEVLVAIPLFVFMGIMLERSRIAEELLEAMGRLFGRVRGGLAVSVSVVGALLAASTGIIGATVVTMGLMALPAMLRRGYDKSFAAGSICAAGTLGQIIPPSTVMVILGEVLSAAYQQAQLAQGKFTVETVSVGQLFAGALFPGLALVGLYVLYQLARAWLDPRSAPAIPAQELGRLRGRELFSVLVPPIVLIVAVLGSILGGIATPTEAAAVGAVGATLLAARRSGGLAARLAPWAGLAAFALALLGAAFDMRLGREQVPLPDRIAMAVAAILVLLLATGILAALVRLARTGVLAGVAESTASITAMIFATLLGATLFALVFRGLGGEEVVRELLGALPGGELAALLAVMAVMFLMGFVLDFVEITIIVIPIVGPVLLGMGMDPIWLGVLIALNIQTSFLTPPFGFALFYLGGVAPREVTSADIYRGIAPFVALQLVALGIVVAFPGLATWLPSRLF
ncbi:MAG: TRAP transporter large permease subunit [Geminicoccaceae bacterium]|nr:TRAP transporter large permease subunit [Geminicoccaceae bacterium]MCS7267438.1 TRAP transporter large permease subunit [Geminicoccaceae bacterium]MCX7630617.1 TRAP transporter large permease subunit [Geminicoccaceae bacterium]MDW8125064.1 TRAP transporter large permease subunit [Geminicoccaceae bacterium]MDW8342294.1 TRAP transporter large permease subunit [Geminicoccaceae bacterium]